MAWLRIAHRYWGLDLQSWAGLEWSSDIDLILIGSHLNLLKVSDLFRHGIKELRAMDLEYMFPQIPSLTDTYILHSHSLYMQDYWTCCDILAPKNNVFTICY